MNGIPRIGVLLAAGQSTRMGRPKQLLPWPPKSTHAKSMVAVAFDAIEPVCDAMVVVVGHEANAVLEALGGREFGAVAVDAGAEMIASVKAGLAIARGIDPNGQVLLHPADCPDVRRAALDALCRAAAEHPGRAVIPTYGGAGGHPVLIAAELVMPIVAFEGEGGLRQFWLDRPESCLRLPVDDAGVVFDVDTESDYGRGIR